MRELTRLIDNAIKHAQPTQEMEILSSTRIDSANAIYTCRGRNGVVYPRVRGAPGLTGGAVVAFVNNDAQRPEIVAPALARTSVQSDFTMP